MSYSQNPFDSKAGRDILKENFRLVFAADELKPQNIQSTKLHKITSHFVNNTEQIINNILKFSKGYKPIPVTDAFESGIYVCPHCMRRDWMNFWEFDYVGYVDKTSMGDKKLDFKKQAGPGSRNKNQYNSIARVKCNEVWSCGECYATYSHEVNYCNSSNCNNKTFKKVGCGKYSYAEHSTPSMTVDQMFSNPEESNALSVGPNMPVYIQYNISPNIMETARALGNPTAFEYIIDNTGRMADAVSSYQAPQNYKDMANSVPKLAVAYSNKKLMNPNNEMCVGKPVVNSYPISPMRLFNWPSPPRFQCCNREHIDNIYQSNKHAKSYRLGKDLGTSYWCTTVDQRTGKQHGAKWKEKLGILSNRSMPKITAPNPLPHTPQCLMAGICGCRDPDCAVQSKQFRKKGVYKISLEMRPRKFTSETNQYVLYLPVKYTLQKFMEDIVEVSLGSGGRLFCPNDPIIKELEDALDCDGLNEFGILNSDSRITKRQTIQTLIDEGRDDIVEILSKYASGIITGPTGSFSQLTLEACSERGVYYNQWLDYSSPVVNTAGDMVPRYLFINQKQQEYKNELATLCREINNFPARDYKFRYRRYHNVSSWKALSIPRVTHGFSKEFILKPHDAAQLLPVLAGTDASISNGGSIFTTEFWRKLRGTNLKRRSDIDSFQPFVITEESSFMPTQLIASMPMPLCNFNGKVTKAVSKEQEKEIATHVVDAGIPYIDFETRTAYTVVRCETCNGIVDAEGVLNYRRDNGWVTAAGVITGRPRYYTQDAFDRELVHELSASQPEWEPFTTSTGFRVCPNWGIDDFGVAKKFGKAMLKGMSTGSMEVGVRRS